jgi:hypothetical protein
MAADIEVESADVVVASAVAPLAVLLEDRLSGGAIRGGSPPLP